MINWHKYPFIRLVLPFILGIWLVLYFGQIINLQYILWTIGSLFVVIVISSTWIKSFRYRWVFGFALKIMLIFMGMGMVLVRQTEMQRNHFSNTPSTSYIARLAECPTERPNSFKVILETEFAIDSNEIIPVNGKILAYFPKEDSGFPLTYGDLILFTAQPECIAAPKNPEEFNYKDYLYRKGITHQVYLQNIAWTDLHENHGRWIYRLSYAARDRLLTTLLNCGIKGDEFGVAAAILLGYDDSLPYNLKQGYVAAGSMHILCVSGMHVGVIFLLASFLLGFMKGKHWHNYVKQSILLFIIWFYALIAGLSPSILRATFMLTFVIIGSLIKRKGFALNSIAASAFILLCINPNNLMEIGFLLSYIAVIGIIVLQRPIYQLFYIKNKAFDYIWSITSVALAAQIATAPFSIYYFHQFPSYFWLSNLILTPLSSIIIMGGMILLLISFIPILNTAVGWAISSLIFLMNGVVTWIESLPLSIIKGLYLNNFEFVLLIIALLMLLQLISLKQNRYLFGLLISFIFILTSMNYRLFEENKTEKMIVYSLNKHSGIDFIYGHEHIILCDSTLRSDTFAVNYSMNNNWIKHGLDSNPEFYNDNLEIEDNIYLKKKKNLISFSDHIIALWDYQETCHDSLSYRIPVDYMIISGRKKENLEDILNCYDVKTLIIDGSVPNYRAEKWIESAQKLNQNYYSVAHSGAFIVDFNQKEKTYNSYFQNLTVMK